MKRSMFIAFVLASMLLLPSHSPCNLQLGVARARTSAFTPASVILLFCSFNTRVLLETGR